MNALAIGILVTSAAFAQSPGERALQMNEAGNRASDRGDYVGAAKQYRAAIEIWRTLGFDFEAHLAGSLMNLGSVLCGSGNRLEGAAAFEEALALHRKTLGAHHKRTVTNMNLAATNYLMLGDLQKAEALVDESQPIARAEFPDDIQMARSLEIRASVLNRHGKLREAVAPSQEGLALVIKIAGEDSLEAALANANAAETHRAAGDLARAAPLYRKARVLYEKHLGPNHPRTASLMSQEGLIALQEGKLATAEEAMVRALDVLKQYCPQCRVELAIAQNNLGLLRLRQKRYREANELLSQALELRESFSAQPTAELASALESLAYVRKMLHRDAEAETLKQRALSMHTFR